MFERWDPDRDIRAEIPTDFDRLQLFSELASKIYGHPALSAGVELNWLEKQTRIYFERVYENRARAFQSAKALVRFITGRAWVMSEIGEGVFAFTHQTFLEYFFAHYLDEQTDAVSSLYDQLLPKFARREWDMVSHLALQIKTYRNLRRQNEAIDMLAKSIDSCTKKDDRSAIVSFAARSLEYLAGSESNIRVLLTLIFSQIIAEAGSEANLMLVTRCSECAVERREFVHNTLVDLAVDSFKRSQPPLLQALLANRALSFPSGATVGLPDELKERARKELEEFVSARVDKSEFFAIKGWEWYGLISRGSVAKFGIAPYYHADLHGIRHVDGLTSTMLCASREYHRQYKAGPITQQKAREALAIFGTVGLERLPSIRAEFERRGGSAPMIVWMQALEEFSSSPRTFIGACFCMRLVSELEYERHPHGRVWPEAGSADFTHTIERVVKGRANLQATPIQRMLAVVGSATIFDQAKSPAKAESSAYTQT